MKPTLQFVLSTFLLAYPLIAFAQAPPLIAPTEALSPAEQRSKFSLPEGFEIQLVLSEPDIGQPMNLNFDAKGRLWVSHSVEYPYPAKGEGVEPRERFPGVGDHPPKDRVTVVESIGPDGKAKGVRHFANGLNIPIGQTPLGDGSSALVYSIPAISLHTDTDGDGKADVRNELYGRFGNIDTHGMANSFTSWIDGWIYGCHGFANHSVIKDGSGQTTDMTSGNTYRFRADGSRFEQFTFGQVNPFGMAFDELGNLYDADCHSMPVYLLLKGASYPHFGNKPDSLGFGPKMIDHNHGSTGICGVGYYGATHFPKEFQGSLFICNPVTGRVHYDRLKAFGSTYQVDSQPDFIKCDDPWFRPVDAVLGPDGALYIADFYNAIIGHYEVPLPHPKRDREKGRVWRIVYKGKDGKHSPNDALDLTKLETEQLLGELENENLLIRTLATNYLVSAHAEKAIPLARKAVISHASAVVRAHALWVVERLDRLSDSEISRLADDPDRLVRVHLVKSLAERVRWSDAEFSIVQKSLADQDAFVQRAAAEALGRHPHPGNWPLLLETWNRTPEEDTHLIHTIKLALKSHFEAETAAKGIPENLSGEEAKQLLPIASASSSPAAVEFLLSQGQLKPTDREAFQAITLRIAESGSPEQITRLIKLAQSTYADDSAKQFPVFRTFVQGFSKRGLRPEEHLELSSWFEELAPRLLEEIATARDRWTYRPLPESASARNPFGLKERKLANGESQVLIDSIVGGETLTGIYKSRAFKLPKRLQFWMCGHNGLPGTDPEPVNHVRLRLTESDQIVAKEFPPRNDTGAPYTWDLSEHAGKQAVFEIVDQSTLKTYAWIAAGGFDPPLIEIPGGSLGDEAEAFFGMIGEFGLKNHLPQLKSQANDGERAPGLRLSALSAAIELGAGNELLPAVETLLAQRNVDSAIRARAFDVLGDLKTDEARELLTKQFAEAPANVQREIALVLSSSPDGALELLASIQKGKASARLLQDPAVKARFDRFASDAAQKQAAQLLANLPSLERRLLEGIAERRKSFPSADASAERGKAVFTKNCAACHKIGTEGAMIGPQLDGVGLRGVDRLLEDMLDPNRNVDVSFRTQTILTSDGRVLTGLKRREEGRVLVIADQKGKEISIPVSEIEETRSSGLSLMPANYLEVLKPAEVYDLLAYLLTLQTKPED